MHSNAIRLDSSRMHRVGVPFQEHPGNTDPSFIVSPPLTCPNLRLSQFCIEGGASLLQPQARLRKPPAAPPGRWPLTNLLASMLPTKSIARVAGALIGLTIYSQTLTASGQSATTMFATGSSTIYGDARGKRMVGTLTPATALQVSGRETNDDAGPRCIWRGPRDRAHLGGRPQNRLVQGQS